MIKLPPTSAKCQTCGHVVMFEEISDDAYPQLLAAYCYEKFEHELRMLNRVTDFYDRNPGIEEKLGSDHWTRAEALNQEWPRIEDAEVIHYLRNHIFKLEGRLPFVRDWVERGLRAMGQIHCPICRVGELWLTKGIDDDG